MYVLDCVPIMCPYDYVCMYMYVCIIVFSFSSEISYVISEYAT